MTYAATHYLSATNLRAYFFQGAAFGANTILEDVADGLASAFDNALNSAMGVSSSVTDAFGDLSNAEMVMFDMYLQGEDMSKVMAYAKAQGRDLFLRLRPTKAWQTSPVR